VHGGRAFLAGVAIGAVTMSAIGLVASGFIESPLQVASQAAPPAPSVLTATVRWQVLRSTVVFGGRVSAGKTIDVTASAPYSTVIVTRMPVRTGQRVWPGDLLTEVDGRPVFALQGMLPAYRDLREGDTGPDVTQLQRALERLGYADFDPRGYFGESTELALALFYRHLGYAAPIDRTERRPAADPPPSGTSIRPASTGIRSASTGIRPTADPPPSSTSIRPAGTGIPLSGTGVPPSAAWHPRATGNRPGGRWSASAGHQSEPAEAYLPISEVVYIPASSALVVSVNARAGTVVTGGPVIRLATGAPTVTGKLGRYQARLVRAGMTARITSAGLRLARYGVVTYVGSYPVRNGKVSGSGAGYPVAVSGLRPLPQHLIGAKVRLTLLIAATSRPVLAVPLAAIAPAASRSAQVIRIAGGGRKVRVKVVTGVSAGGLVAVRPATPGALAAGDRVVIGLSR